VKAMMMQRGLDRRRFLGYAETIRAGIGLPGHASGNFIQQDEQSPAVFGILAADEALDVDWGPDRAGISGPPAWWSIRRRV
jgi:hypothetical protein